MPNPAPSLDVVPVAGRRDRREFLDLPARIYRDDPRWVAPLRLERSAFINPKKHPFYRHGSAQRFLARRAGRVVGRIQASDDPRYNEYHGTNVGAFGMFECEDDPEAARALLSAAAEWLRRRGRDAVFGPVDYSTNYTCGLLVDGFDTPPTILMSHNPPYYADLLASWGLEATQDLNSWWLDGANDLAARWRGKLERLAARSGVTLRTLDPGDLDGEIERCREVIDSAWADNWGFVPMTDAELRYFAELLRHIADPRMLMLAEAGGEPVGMMLTVPNVNEALRPIGGRLTRWGLPIGYFRLRAGMKRIRTCRVLMLGVKPSHRRRGVIELLISRSNDYVMGDLGYVGGEMGWTLADNDAINTVLERIGGQRTRTYRLYRRGLG